MFSNIVTSKCRNVKEHVRFMNLYGTELEVVERRSGTRGSDYYYVHDGSFFIPISAVPGARLVSKEPGRRIELTYKVPTSSIKGPILHVSFSNSGYPLFEICTLSNNSMQCCICDCDEDSAKVLLNMFKLSKDEVYLVRFYMDTVSPLINDIKSVMVRSKTSDIRFGGYAERLRETFETPYFSLLTLMALPDEKGRIQSIEVRLSHIVELWVFTKLIEAIDGETLDRWVIEGLTINSPGNNWWIEFMRNEPIAFIKSRRNNEKYTIYYQPSIYPHVLQFSEEYHELRRRGIRNVVPDFVVFKGIIKERIGWGELHNLNLLPQLVIEVKTGLERTQWASPEYVIKQLDQYRHLLKPKHLMLTVLTKINDGLRRKLENMGIVIIDDLLNKQGELGELIHNLL